MTEQPAPKKQPTILRRILTAQANSPNLSRRARRLAKRKAKGLSYRKPEEKGT